MIRQLWVCAVPTAQQTRGVRTLICLSPEPTLVCKFSIRKPLQHQHYTSNAALAWLRVNTVQIMQTTSIVFTANTKSKSNPAPAAVKKNSLRIPLEVVGVRNQTIPNLVHAHLCRPVATQSRTRSVLDCSLIRRDVCAIWCFCSCELRCRGAKCISLSCFNAQLDIFAVVNCSVIVLSVFCSGILSWSADS